MGLLAQRDPSLFLLRKQVPQRESELVLQHGDSVREPNAMFPEVELRLAGVLLVLHRNYDMYICTPGQPGA
jgi:hypothetical protein